MSLPLERTAAGTAGKVEADANIENRLKKIVLPARIFSVDHFFRKKKSGAVHGSGQSSRVGSGRVESGQLTRPDPRNI